VGIIAPSSSFDRDLFESGVAVLEEMGFRPIFGSRLFEQNRHLAGNDEQRLSDLTEMVQNHDVTAVLAARGGFGSIRLVDRLNFQIFTHNPKIFAGFSDLSILLNVIAQRGFLITFHGPNVTTLSTISDLSKESFFRMVTAEVFPPLLWERTRVLRPGRARGMLAGGNLTTLCHLMGTPFEPSFDGCVLIIEDVNEPLYRIDRMLTQLKLCGKLEGLEAVLLGAFDGCPELDEVYERVLELIPDPNVAVWADMPLGHGLDNYTWPIGAEAILAEEGVVRFDEGG
jgi:muramoyltetrapeptide carboxypeptidase